MCPYQCAWYFEASWNPPTLQSHSDSNKLLCDLHQLGLELSAVVCICCDILGTQPGDNLGEIRGQSKTIFNTVSENTFNMFVICLIDPRVTGNQVLIFLGSSGALVM